MSSQESISDLVEKHRQLELLIQQELQSPSYSDLRIMELKREKLRIKDQMSTLESNQVH